MLSTAVEMNLQNLRFHL